MDRQDMYRRQAAEAQASAKRARTVSEREAWQRLVEGWLSLLPPQSVIETALLESVDTSANAAGAR
jgi:hypothetical protein